MKQALLSDIHPGRLAPWLLLMLALPLSACFEPTSVVCSSGLVCPQDAKCSGDGMHCIRTPCGDGIVQPEEVCDDGNDQNGDGCSKDCRSNEICGNGEVDLGEVCDDGNTIAGDGCSADCKSKERCGDGFVEHAAGEVCDDGNNRDRDGCSANCRSNESCGNGTVDTTVDEVCDDGNTQNGDQCSSDCHSGVSCGNGYRDENEECDSGIPNTDTATCTSQCKISFCGDGFHTPHPDAGEECDDGPSNSNTSRCLPTCKLNVCGDGLRNPDAEACDDGNTITEDTCPYGTTACSVCNSDCTAEVAKTGAYCGDGNTNGPPGAEICDDGNRVDETQCPYGPTTSCSGCSNNCRVPLSNTTPRFCGDGRLDPEEVCDDGNNVACGTCSGSCQGLQLLTAATGSITAVHPAIIIDGEFFTLNDGSKLVIFEFRKTGSHARGHVRVSINDVTEPSGVASAIKDAINDTSDFNITATVDGEQVNLSNRHRGTHGNQSSSHNVGGGFEVTHMSGGLGGDCPRDTRCMSNDDCQRGLTCTLINGVKMCSS